MDYIVEASIRMEQLINDLLNYSRLGRKSLEMRPVSLGEIIENIHTDFRQKLEEIGATFNTDEAFPVIPGDESLLRQIFTNLIDNAINYRRTEVPLIIGIHCEHDTKSYAVSVSDNGIGIPQEHWEKIFNIFQRLHSEDEYRGTGIGLATVKKAVSMLDGTVRVESIVGKGSIFIIHLPESKTLTT
jgi:signal transduction histidine kinase